MHPVADPTSRPTDPTDPASGWAAVPGNVLRGMAIGAAEVVPGVSGGTVALVVGVYERLIDGAGNILRSLRLTLTGQRAAGRETLRGVHWATVVPVLVGMVTAVLIAARLLEPLITDHPVGARAAFFGMVLFSIVVPARMVGAWGMREIAAGALACGAAFALTGLPPGGEVDPPLVVVAIAAAVAVCALVLPGVSGSFLLLTVGLYQPTLAAVNERQFGYLVVFALGAVLGLGVFVKVLQAALRRQHALTLAIMTGLMAGSLRALWPWQDGDRGLLAPDAGWLPMLALVLVIGLAVTAAVVLQARLDREPAAER